MAPRFKCWTSKSQSNRSNAEVLLLIIRVNSHRPLNSHLNRIHTFTGTHFSIYSLNIRYVCLRTYLFSVRLREPRGQGPWPGHSHVSQSQRPVQVCKIQSGLCSLKSRRHKERNSREDPSSQGALLSSWYKHNWITHNKNAVQLVWCQS